MARKLPTQYYTNFSGGLNTIMSASKIADRESPMAENIQYTENGLPSKRQGTDTYANSVGSSVLGLGRLYTSSNRYHVRITGTTFYYNVGGVWTSVSGKTYTAATLVNFCQVRGALYSHDGVNSMGKWDGTTLSTPSTGATALFGIFYAERHVCSGNSSAPSRVYFSSSKSADNFSGLSGTATAGAASTLTDSGKAWVTNEYQSLTITIVAGTGAGQVRTISSNTATVITVSAAWTTNPDTTSQYEVEGGDTLDVAKDDGQAITGLAKFEDKLIIFKEASVYQLTFDDSGNPIVDLVSAAYGCLAHNSIDNVENDIFFLSGDGVRTLGYVQNIPGVLRTNQITAKIQTEVDNINSLYYQRCCAIYNNKHYILCFPQGSSTTNNRVIAFNMLYGAWSVWTGINASRFNEFIETDKKERLYYGDEGTGQVYQMFAANYSDGAATAIAASYYTKQFDFGLFDLRKRIIFVDLQLRALTGTLSIDVIIDGSVTAKSVSLSSTFSQKDGMRIFMFREAKFRQDAGSTASVVATDDVRRVKINQNARTIQVRVSNSNVDETFTLMGVAVGYIPRSAFSFPSDKVIYS